jgi:hypothetical protein
MSVPSTPGIQRIPARETTPLTKCFVIFVFVQNNHHARRP